MSHTSLQKCACSSENPKTFVITLSTDALGGVFCGDASLPVPYDCDVISGVLSSSCPVDSSDV